jgi:hypothetical protein
MNKTGKTILSGLFLGAFLFSILFISQMKNTSAEESTQNIYEIPTIPFKEVNFNNTLVAYNQNGYSYKTKEAIYNFYVKSNSNYGDGSKYCIDYEGTEYCLIYQAQDMSFRDSNKAQDYISSIQGVTGTINGGKILFTNIFPNTSLEYSTDNQGMKENFILSSKPRQPATYLGQNISLDFGGYIKFPNLHLFAEGEEKTTDFTTKNRIDFRTGSGKLLFYLPEPYAVDSSGKKISLQYEVDVRGSEIWFYTKTNFTWLNSSNRVYPVYIDPSAVTGCVSTANLINCSNGNFNGNYIDTNKSILIYKATLNGGSDNLIRLNSTNGWINISSSTLTGNAYLNKATNVNLYASIGQIIINSSSIISTGGNGEFCSAYAGYFTADFSSQGIYFINSNVTSNGGYPNQCTNGATSGGNGNIILNGQGEINVRGSNFTTIGGSGNRHAGDECCSGGSGYFVSTSSNFKVYGEKSYVTISGASGNCGGIAGAQCGNGGSATRTFNDMNITTEIPLMMTMTGGNSASVSGNCNGGSSIINFYGSFLNYTGNISKPAGTSRGTGTSTSLFKILNLSSDARFLFIDGQITGNSEIDVTAREFTLNNFYLSNSGSASKINLTNDIARVGLFGSSVFDNIIPVYYAGTFGKIIVGNSTSRFNLTGISYSLRNSLTTYYEGFNEIPVVTIISPEDNATVTSSSIIVSVLPIDAENSTNLNVSVYSNISGTWELEAYNSSAFNNTQTNLTLSGLTGVKSYLIGASAVDSANGEGFASNITISATVPELDWTPATSWSVSMRPTEEVFNTWTLNNTGAVSITNCVPSISGALADYVTFDNSNFNLSAGQSKDIKVTITHPAEASYSASLSAVCNLSSTAQVPSASNVSITLTSTLTTVGTTGGGGSSSSGSLSVGETHCNLNLVRPTTKIVLDGKAGTTSAKVLFIIENTANATSTFDFTLSPELNKACVLKTNRASVNGKSTFENYIECVFQEETLDGKIIIRSDVQSCDSSISVAVTSSSFGKFVSILNALIKGENISMFGMSWPAWSIYVIALVLLFGIIAVAVIIAHL